MQETIGKIRLYEKAQLVIKRIDPDKFDETYYAKLERELKKEVKKDSTQVIIYFKPTKPITERWIVWSLLDLQRKFTEVLFMPKNSLKDEELEDWFYYKNPLKVYRVD